MAFPSTFVDLQNEVIGSVRLEATDDLQRSKDWVNQVYSAICVEVEAVVTSATSTLTAAAATYAIPSAIARIKQLTVLTSGQTTYSGTLEQVSPAQILDWRQSGTLGSPTHYAVSGYNILDFYPTPTSADTVLFYYVAFPTALSADADVPILQEPYASYCIKYGALAEAANFLKDPSEQEYRSLFEMWMKKYRAHLNRRAGGNTLSLQIGNGASMVPANNSTDLGAWR